MERLCERPGCSERASVAYGMRAEDLVFWLDRLSDAAAVDGGVLCQRHADSMVVPRSWTLDDLRDPDLHLFRPPAAVEQRRTRSRRPASADNGETEQLALGVESSEVESSEDGASEVAADTVAAAAPISDGAVQSASGDGDTSDDHEAWTPNFDTADDLGGLLAASSPLLARAFRGDDRPRETPGSD